MSLLHHIGMISNLLVGTRRSNGGEEMFTDEKISFTVKLINI